jgi:hypothetical protein
MIWRVERTSLSYDDKRSPCEGAVFHGDKQDEYGFPYKDWRVDIPDLLAFLKEYGECVIDLDMDGNGVIEIYDAYRE